MRILLAAVLVVYFCGGEVAAEQFPPVNVYTEDDDAAGKACQIRGSSLVASVESEFRHNHIEVASEEQYRQHEAIAAYVNTTAIDLGRGLCATSYQFYLQRHQFVFVDATDGIRNATLIFCKKGGILSGDASSMQGRLNTQFRNYTSECISEYLAD